MLHQVNRFHGHNSLKFVYRNGESVRASLMTIKYVLNPRRKNSRFAVVVSKKILKLAVGRNRIRRRIYEIVRLEKDKLRDSQDIIFIISSAEVANMPYLELLTAVKYLLSQANLYK